MIIFLTGKLSKEELLAIFVEILAVDIPLGLMVLNILSKL